MERKKPIRNGSAEAYERIRQIKEAIGGEFSKQLLYRWSIEDLRNLQKGLREHKVVLLQKATVGRDRWFHLDSVGRENPLSSYDFWGNPAKQRGLEELCNILQLAGTTDSGDVQYSTFKHLEEAIVGAMQVKQASNVSQPRRALIPAHI
ncbi:MAG: hypothetical protein G01um1014106_605 [Parcubacteria group bacterium Gr01-1014_106]|nr:MAG: hypothetical protein G01um1014106_605 [Parcubacteria group bacterium Gr01-1014_106]